MSHVLPIPVGDLDPAPVGDLDRWPSFLGPRQHVTRNSRPAVGIVSELSKLKGADEIPSLLQILAPVARVLVAGTGPLMSEVVSARLSLPPHERQGVEILGLVPPEEMQEFYERIDYLLILSHTESQCRVVTEAMLQGVLVIARRTTGIEDLIEDGRTGFFLEPWDVGMIADRLTPGSVVNDREEPIRLRAFGQALSAREQHAARWLSHASRSLDLSAIRRRD